MREASRNGGWSSTISTLTSLMPGIVRLRVWAVDGAYPHPCGEAVPTSCLFRQIEEDGSHPTVGLLFEPEVELGEDRVDVLFDGSL